MGVGTGAAAGVGAAAAGAGTSKACGVGGGTAAAGGGGCGLEPLAAALAFFLPLPLPFFFASIATAGWRPAIVADLPSASGWATHAHDEESCSRSRVNRVNRILQGERPTIRR